MKSNITYQQSQEENEKNAFFSFQVNNEPAEMSEEIKNGSMVSKGAKKTDSAALLKRCTEPCRSVPDTLSSYMCPTGCW
jgi:hypothetical protein